ncbi:MAG: sulfur oxidation c-type cytochrome SoxA [Gammaproteobacteria bacterium]|nr:sulfur oxidation c-type cytochrome SoxA [Gammaproteobacteria bacterium]
MLTSPFVVNASPQQDLKDFRAFFKNKFPATPMNDFINGVYSIHKASREQWEAFEEFPSYEIYVDKGEALFNDTKFKNGKGFKDCFPKGQQGIKGTYPYFSAKSGKVVTLEGDINKCITSNGSEKWGWKKGKMAYLSAYLAYQTRGQTINVNTPKGEAAVAAYNRGKAHFYAKRGQLNMSCADCHYYYSGNKIRADILSPALGHVSHFPVYRNKWAKKSGDGMGTLHRRYGGCNKQVRARPFKAQSAEYSALEYFHTYMSNGLKWNGPGQRK